MFFSTLRDRLPFFEGCPPLSSPCSLFPIVSGRGTKIPRGCRGTNPRSRIPLRRTAPRRVAPHRPGIRRTRGNLNPREQTRRPDVTCHATCTVIFGLFRDRRFVRRWAIRNRPFSKLLDVGFFYNIVRLSGRANMRHEKTQKLSIFNGLEAKRYRFFSNISIVRCVLSTVCLRRKDIVNVYAFHFVHLHKCLQPSYGLGKVQFTWKLTESRLYNTIYPEV